MAGVSSKASQFGNPKNRNGYNGNELQNKEFNDGSGLELYDFNARTYDQQLGRFIQIDPLSDEENQDAWTPYHFTFDNPIFNADPDGKFPLPVIFWVIATLSAETVATTTVVTTTVVVTTAAAADAVANAPSKPVGGEVSANVRAEGYQTSGSTLTMGTGGSAPFSSSSRVNSSSSASANTSMTLGTSKGTTQAGKAMEGLTKKYGGQADTNSETRRQSFRKAKDQNRIPRSQQPDRTRKPNTPEGDDANLDSRNVRQYEFTDSEGKRFLLEKIKPLNIIAEAKEINLIILMLEGPLRN